jgi:hypothetical protein
MIAKLLLTLHYPLPVPTLILQLCDAIMAPIVQAGSPRASFRYRTYIPPRTGVLPYRISKARYSQFAHESGIAHIERILKYSHIDVDITRQLIRASAKQGNITTYAAKEQEVMNTIAISVFSAGDIDPGRLYIRQCCIEMLSSSAKIVRRRQRLSKGASPRPLNLDCFMCRRKLRRCSEPISINPDRTILKL